jgi:two-component sensor histidine kinase
MTAAAEREVLLRELQHRVGNNLQALYALLHRNQQAAKTEHSRALIGDALKRVETMMDAHAQLASGHARGEVPIAPFLARVCAALAPPGPHVRIETEFDECDVPMKHAVTIGMIVNEIVTNSLKHAFPPDLGGTVRIEFRTDGTQTHGEVVVSDTGRGMGPPRPGGQGLTLIRSLAAQLGGTVFRDEPVTGGTRYRMAFPLPPK